MHSQILSSDKKIIGEFLKIPFFSDIVKNQGVDETYKASSILLIFHDIKGDVMLKKIISVIVALSISTISTGCASMFTGTTSNINVTSTPTGADCDVTGHGVHTPGNIVLEKSSSDLTITCQKEGFEDGSSKIISSFNTTSLVNILTVYGMVLGFIVDFSTGAAWEYTNQVNVNLIKKAR